MRVKGSLLLMKKALRLHRMCLALERKSAGGDRSKVAEDLVFLAEDRIFPLEASLKDQLERLLSADLSGLRIHIGPQADAITKGSGAQAVTIGRDIYFAKGCWDPEGSEGQKLLLHELTHYLQGMNNDRMVYLEDISDLEQEAERLERLLQDHLIEQLDRADFADADSFSTAWNRSGSVGSGATALAKRNTQRHGTGLADYSAKSENPSINLRLQDGSAIRIDKGVYETLLMRARERFLESREDETMLLSESDREKAALDYYRWLNRGYLT